MTNQRIDVLAVMDRLISHQRLAWGIPDDDLVEARAAMAEVIEACKARDLADGLAIQADIENGHGLCPEKARAAHVALTEANLRYYAALVRIGGAS